MKILAQCGIMFGICAAGVVISVVTRLPVPGNVWGIIILFLLLYFKVITKQQIRRVSRFLIGNMAFFFLPSGVAILAHFDAIRHVLVPYLLIIVFTTVIVLSVTGTFSQWIQRLLGGRKVAVGGSAPLPPPVQKLATEGARPVSPRRPSHLPPESVVKSEADAKDTEDEENV